MGDAPRTPEAVDACIPLRGWTVGEKNVKTIVCVCVCVCVRAR